MATALPRGENRLKLVLGNWIIHTVFLGSPRPAAVIEETTQIPTNSTVYSISSEDEVNILVGAIKNVTCQEGDTLT